MAAGSIIIKIFPLLAHVYTYSLNAFYDLKIGLLSFCAICNCEVLCKKLICLLGSYHSKSHAIFPAELHFEKHIHGCTNKLD